MSLGERDRETMAKMSSGRVWRKLARVGGLIRHDRIKISIFIIRNVKIELRLSKLSFYILLLSTALLDFIYEL